MSTLSEATLLADGVINLWDQLFKAIIVICTFGGSITFQVIIQKVEDNTDWSETHRFDYKDARSFLAVAWTAFLIALGISCAAVIVLRIKEDDIRSCLVRGEERKFVIIGGVASFICQETVVGAFGMSSLAVTAYSNKAGWTAAGFTIILGIATPILWIWQVLETKRRMRKQLQSLLSYRPTNGHRRGMGSAGTSFSETRTDSSKVRGAYKSLGNSLERGLSYPSYAKLQAVIWEFKRRDAANGLKKKWL
ncbi:hypothetical protein K469DRAFT_753983 [Zopfia rhizophila CBS 207.26]|uniref:Uncharacterized protein n=1 Tax=Zopfia rhizophila CBS 207.26 TaxID=1314779 RepID=A0A6A6DIX0_9PEZI|nr:hypothetical protein K469DRAFT_753983 [Zopfia rhizophila CBS 207.26]